MNRIGQLILSLTLVGIGWFIPAGSVFSDPVPPQPWGPGMTYHIEWYAGMDGIPSSTTKFYTSQDYEEDSEYMTPEVFNTIGSHVLSWFETVKTNTYPCGEIRNMPTVGIAPSPLGVVSVYRDWSNSGTCPSSGSPYTYARGYISDSMICPTGTAADWNNRMCNDSIPSCGDYIGTVINMSVPGSYRFSDQECYPVAGDLMCHVHRTDDNKGLSITMQGEGESEPTSYGGKYEVTTETSACTQNPNDPRANDLQNDQDLGPAPDGCITGTGGQQVCLDADGGSDMIATDDQGNQIDTPDSSICIEAGGTFSCFQVEPDQPGCGYVNGEYNCYGVDGNPIDSTDPDHPNNGGNADGNSNNDLLDPSNSGDGLTDGESDALLAEAIGNAVGEAIGTSLDGTVTDAQSESIESAVTSGLPRDEETGELITQEKQAEDTITNLGDFNNFIDPSAERLRIKSEVQQAFGFDNPACSDFNETIFGSTGLGGISLDFNCSDTQLMRNILEYVLWIFLVVYLFLRVTRFNFKGAE